MDTTAQPTLSNNSIAFLALCNEYCSTVENVSSAYRADFVTAMTRLLPRIYISAADLPADYTGDVYYDQSLDEDAYETVRRSMERLMGSEDVYLEVFEEDMKYSDTPIAASISEGLADLYQVFYNLLSVAREAPADVVGELLGAVAEDFASYWSSILCNVMRALNHVRYGAAPEDEEL